MGSLAMQTHTATAVVVNVHCNPRLLLSVLQDHSKACTVCKATGACVPWQEHDIIIVQAIAQDTRVARSVEVDRNNNSCGHVLRMR